MNKCLLFMVIIILSTYLVIVPKGTIGFFDVKDAVSSSDDNNIELYVTSWCHYSQKAIAFLESKRVPFEVYDIEKDAAAASRKNQMTTKKGVPFAVIYGQKIHGFSEASYQKALNARGDAQVKAKEDNLDQPRQGKSDKKPKSWQLQHRSW